MVADGLASDRIGERLGRARLAAGLSVRALATRAGVRNTTVGYIEQGQHEPSVALVERLALALALPPAWLAFGDGPEPAALQQGGRQMSQDDPILMLFAEIKQHQVSGRKAPHKPLLLLLMLGRLRRREARLARYGDVEKPLRDLLARFSPGRPHPEFPFWHLASDARLWEQRGAERLPPFRETPGPKQVRDAALEGGLREAVHRALTEDPALFDRAVAYLLEHNFPKDQHADLRAAVGL